MEIPSFDNQLQVLNISECTSIARWPSPPCSNHGTCVKVNSTETLEEILACYCEPGFNAEGDALFDTVPGYDGVYGDCDISTVEIMRIWRISAVLGALGVLLLVRLFWVKKKHMRKKSLYQFIKTRQIRACLFTMVAQFLFFLVSVLKIVDDKKYVIGRHWGTTIVQLSAAFFVMTGQFEGAVFLLESSTNPFTRQKHSTAKMQNAANKLKSSLRSLGNLKYLLYAGIICMSIPIIVMIFLPHQWETLHIISTSSYMMLHTILKFQKRHYTNEMQKVLEFLQQSQPNKNHHVAEFEEIQQCLKRQNSEDVGDLVTQNTISLLFVVWPLLRHKMPYYSPVTLIVGLSFICMAAFQESKSVSNRIRRRDYRVGASSKSTNPEADNSTPRNV